MRALLAGTFSFGLMSFMASTAANADADRLARDVVRLSDEVVSHGPAYEELRELAALGPRLSGTEGAARGVAWAKAKMEGMGFDRVELQPMMAPHWQRGDHEAATLRAAGSDTALAVAALGGSVATPEGGIEAPVVEVQTLSQLRALGTSVRGKIVFFNRPMRTDIDPFEAYGAAVDQRTRGPALAASLGAKAALVRSLTTLTDDVYPHTGETFFSGSSQLIPAAALSTRSANLLAERLRSEPQAQVRLELSAKRLPDVRSYNVIGEIRGSELPNEVVVVGAHLDSWDLGAGAHDDGAGVVESLAVAHAFKALGMRPKRTVRVVLFMSEESGGIGGEAYAEAASREAVKHVAALESDRGGFAPVGFSVAGDLAAIAAFRPYLAPLGAGQIVRGGAGTDVEPLGALGAITMDFLPVPTHYFDFHHAASDQLDAVSPTDLRQSAAAITAMVYLLSEALPSP